MSSRDSRNIKILREWVKDALLHEMAYAERGFAYEAELQQKLAAAGLGPPGATAGSGHGADIIFTDLNSINHGVEVKLNANVFAGQKNCQYLGAGNWSWASQDDLTTFYDEMGLINDFILPTAQKRLETFMTFFDASKIPLTISNQEYWDFRNENPDFSFELVKTDASPDAIYQNYIQKGVHYIQVGGGYGFYYLDSDPLALGVPQFKPSKVQVRSRLKWGGSSSGVDIPKYYDSTKASDPAVANKRSTVSWNNGLTLSGLSPSPFNLDDDLEFLRMAGNSNTLRAAVRESLLFEELTSRDKKDLERLAKKHAKAMIDKELASAVEKEFTKRNSKLNKVVNDTITDRFKQAKSDKDFDDAVIKIAKRVLKGLHDMHYKRSNLVDQMPVPKS
jgi:hypothetical protein